MLGKDTYYKYKNIILYIFFGICTTIVNIGTYWCMAHILRLSITISTILAWITAVLFAYVTNRKWVFHSKAIGVKYILTEIMAFFSCRVATGIVDLFIMWFCVDYLCFNDMIIKFISNIAVILLNYIASKFVIFKR